ncbi:MAG: HAD hydrolase family protein [Candidatus Bathyarchaeia archaeon]
MLRRVFISDCEGPISKNDNAFELTAHFIPDGDKLFTVISRYDDVLADVLKRPGYKAGDTLKLILPFLKAYDVTDNKMREFSAKSLVLISNIKSTLEYIRGIAHAFIVSTSYEHYIRALCQALGFPYEYTYCTLLSIDKYYMTEKEKAELKEIAEEIAQMPIIDIPTKAKSLKDFSERDQKIIRRLDEIFWKQIACTDCGRIFSEVNPIGGSEKAEAIKDAAQKVNTQLADAMYVGDSITDVEAFKLVKENGGLAVSFNGNEYAIRNAEVAVLSENSIVTAVIADAFCNFGKQQTLRFVENWSREALKKSQLNRALLNRLFQVYPSELPKVKIITSENMEILAKESSEFRRKVRGEAIGRLG